MEALLTALQFILALAILVTLHELGHFLAARAFGIKVKKFYLFFDAWGFKFFSFKYKDTEYGIGWLPLGGYVKIAGMIDESMDTDQLKSEPQPWEFRSKPAWQRLIVMIGGVVVNLILGIVIFISLTFSQGETYIPNSAINTHGGIYASPMARKVGLKTGDKILLINGKPVDNLLNEFSNPEFLVSYNKFLKIERDGKDTTIKLPVNMEDIISQKSDLGFFAPRFSFSIKQIMKGSNSDKGGLKVGDFIDSIDGNYIGSFFEFKEMLLNKAGKTAVFSVHDSTKAKRNLKINITEEGTIGFFPNIIGFAGFEKHIDYSFLQSAKLGTEKSFTLISANAKGFGKILKGKVNPKNSLMGPIGIAQQFGGNWDWINFWGLTAMLSLALAFMNILPIPALDGGHVMFLMYELITRRPVNEKVLYVGQIIGMVVLLSLMVFIFWVDIARLLGF